MNPRYIVDTCSFTRLQRLYPEDLFPGPWLFISQLASDGILASAEDVLVELNSDLSLDDPIAQWANARREIFIELTEDIQLSAMEILAQHRTLIDLGKGKSGADPLVIATARVMKCAVVTDENKSNAPGKVKIPDVCHHLGIPCYNLLEMLRLEGFKAKSTS